MTSTRYIVPLLGSSVTAVAQYTAPIVPDLQRQAFHDNSTHELTAVLMGALARSAHEGSQQQRVILSCTCDASAPVRAVRRARALGPFLVPSYPPVCALRSRGAGARAPRPVSARARADTPPPLAAFCARARPAVVPSRCRRRAPPQGLVLSEDPPVRAALVAPLGDALVLVLYARGSKAGAPPSNAPARAAVGARRGRGLRAPLALRCVEGACAAAPDAGADAYGSFRGTRARARGRRATRSRRLREGVGRSRPACRQEASRAQLTKARAAAPPPCFLLRRRRCSRSSRARCLQPRVLAASKRSCSQPRRAQPSLARAAASRRWRATFVVPAGARARDRRGGHRARRALRRAARRLLARPRRLRRRRRRRALARRHGRAPRSARRGRADDDVASRHKRKQEAECLDGTLGPAKASQLRELVAALLEASLFCGATRGSPARHGA